KALYWFGFSRAFSRYGDSRAGAFIRDSLQPLASNGDNRFPSDEAVDWVRYWENISDFGPELLQRNHLLALHVIQDRTGAHVQYEDNLPETDHIFPRATLRNKGYDETLVNHFANFWVLAREKNRNKSDTPPGDYFADVPDTELKRA